MGDSKLGILERLSGRAHKYPLNSLNFSELISIDVEIREVFFNRSPMKSL
jgi:hypothetical protein